MPFVDTKVLLNGFKMNVCLWFSVLCGYMQCVVPLVVTVLRHQKLGIEVLAVA